MSIPGSRGRLLAAEIDRPTYSRVQALLVLAAPSLAVLGGLMPGFGPIFAFRLLAPLFFISVVISARPSEGRSVVRTLALTTAWVWFVVLCGTTMLNGLSAPGLTEGASLIAGLTLLGAAALGPASAVALRLWARAWLIAYWVCGAIASWELLTGSHLPNYYAYVLNLPAWTPTTAIAATLGNPNNYAQFLIVSSLIFILGYALDKTRRGRLAFAITVATVPIFTLATESRLAVALLAVLALGYLVLRKPALMAFAVLLAVGAVVVAVLNPDGMSRALGLDDSGLGGALAGDASAVVRVNLMLNGLDFTLETALGGLGPGGFEPRMGQGGRFPTAGIVNPHSAAVEILTQYGIVVTIAVVALLFAILVSSGRVYGSGVIVSAGDRVVAIALMLAVLSLPFVTLTSSSTLDLSFPWVYLAILVMGGRYMDYRAMTS